MDVVLKIPAVEQLLKMTASGIGAVAGPMLARWNARAQADALRIEGKGKADAIGLIASAQAEAADKLENIPSSARTDLHIRREIEARLTFQEKKRQRNIESVVRRAADELGEREVEANEIDHDWTAAFFSEVQDVSSDRMQEIWAKILTGEVERPGATSIQTLFILRVMSQRDADLFQRVNRFVLGKVVVTEEEIIQRISDFPHFKEFLRLSDLNLFHIGALLQVNWKEEKDFSFGVRDMAFRMYRENQEKLDLSIRTYALTSPGTELYGVIEAELAPEYLGEFARYLNARGIVLATAQILSGDEENWDAVGPWEILGVDRRVDWTPISTLTL